MTSFAMHGRPKQPRPERSHQHRPRSAGANPGMSGICSRFLVARSAVGAPASTQISCKAGGWCGGFAEPAYTTRR